MCDRFKQAHGLFLDRMNRMGVNGQNGIPEMRAACGFVVFIVLVLMTVGWRDDCG